ncbi:hypothetical protein SLS62_007911 [Diatrype stigma]|uniref:Peptidase M14 domain-containing protein n=1 Tax=Diatrype stigma TaxID=117547 RepID=A0AAN9UQ10_9PEZI
MQALVYLALLMLPKPAVPTALPSSLYDDPVSLGEKVSYDGYRVYRIDLARNAPVVASALEETLKGFHTIHTRNYVEVAVPPSQAVTFEGLGLTGVELINDDLGRDIAAGAMSISSSSYDSLHSRIPGELPDLSWFDTYHSYDDHLQYWADLQASFPENSELFDAGPSYEGRRIFGLRLWDDGADGNNTSKPIILWHATVHAREWISTALIAGYQSGDEEVKSLLDYYDFYIVPFHNPDGFVYTQTTDRLWRKNRQPRDGTDCIGTDGNRNWGYKWDHPINGSVLTDPCGQTYHGEAAGDTPENIALSALSAKLAAGGSGIRSFIDWHSYGQLITLPWGWSCEPEDLPANLEEQRAVGAGYAAAIFNATGAGDGDGTVYDVGPACEILYYGTGSARDYHQGALDAPFSWTVELRPREASGGGFVLPAEFIWPTVKEQWAGLRYVLHAVK